MRSAEACYFSDAESNADCHKVQLEDTINGMAMFQL